MWSFIVPIQQEITFQHFFKILLVIPHLILDQNVESNFASIHMVWTLFYGNLPEDNAR